MRVSSIKIVAYNIPFRLGKDGRYDLERVASEVDEFYSEIQNNGGSRWDTSSLLTRLK